MDDFAKQLALLAHRAALNEIAEIQMRSAQRRLIQEMHGEQALPIREFYRTMLLTRQQTLAGASELVAKEAESDRNRLAVLYPLVEILEERFREYHDKSDAAWAEGIADFIRRRRR